MSSVCEVPCVSFFHVFREFCVFVVLGDFCVSSVFSLCLHVEFCVFAVFLVFGELSLILLANSAVSSYWFCL